MNKVVIGIVGTRAQAETVVQALRDTQHIRAEDISVMLPDTQGSKDFAHEQNTKAPEGAATGAGAGGVLGGTLGLLAGIGALAIPGVGPLIAAGPLLAALSGAAAGAAVGGLTGALVGLGIPEIEAKAYEGKLKGGNILIAIHTANKEAQHAAEEALKRAGAEHVSSTSEASVPRDARA
jgi:uncharacterized membrane protein